mgnify:CR=1 FL=1
MRRTKPTGAYEGRESSFQASAIKLVRAIAGPDVLVIHCPNGRNAGSARMGGFWKGQGVVKGVPDIMVFYPQYDQKYDEHLSGLGIELKVYPNKPDEDQIALHEQLRKNGWEVEVCYGLGEVEDITKEYFGK